MFALGTYFFSTFNIMEPEGQLMIEAEHREGSGVVLEMQSWHAYCFSTPQVSWQSRLKPRHGQSVNRSFTEGLISTPSNELAAPLLRCP